MKKIFKYLFIILVAFFIFGCEFPTNTTGGESGEGGGNTTPIVDPVTHEDFSMISFKDASFTYDGEPKSIEVSGLPEGATVVYKDNVQTEIGEYFVTATVTINEESKKFYALLTIKDIDYFENITFTGQTFVYDGEVKSLAVENLNENVSVTYSNNDKVDAGVYVVTAKLTDIKNNTKSIKATLTIKKATGTIEVADGQEAYLSEGIDLGATIDNNEQVIAYKLLSPFTEDGSYNVEVYAEETTNYFRVSKVVTVNLFLNPLKIYFPTDVLYANGETLTVELDGELPAGYTVQYVNNAQSKQGRYNVTANVYDSANELYCSINGIMVIDNQRDADFDVFLDDFLVLLFEGDQMSINFFFVNPENYGLEHYDAELPIYEKVEDYEAEMQEVQTIIDELHAFSTKALSFEQLISYVIIDEYLNYIISITDNMQYMTNGYLGSYLGYQSNLPLNLAEYKFRNEQDIKDFISYLETAQVAFESYYQFCVDQNAKGYGLTDTAIDNVVSQCQKFYDEKDNHYLVAIFNDKIDNITFDLSDEQIAAYKAQCKTAIEEDLCNAYKYVADNLPNLKGADIIEGGLYNYGEEGLEYYRLDLGKTVGIYDIDIEETIAYIEAALKKYNKQMNDVVTSYRSMSAADQRIFLNAVNNSEPAFSDLDPEGLLELFQVMAQSFVPTIDEMPEITVKYVYKSLEDNFSPAAYFVSPLDETKYESIYLNGKYTDDTNYIFTTLAHEGYPGHLYQNVYAKSLDISNIRKALRCQGYMEGWAVYMELNSYSFVSSYKTAPLKAALQYAKLNDIVNGLLSCRVDLGIHGQGWGVNEIAQYMTNTFGSEYTVADVQDFYDQVVEIPTNMSMYYFSWLTINDLHQKAVDTLGIYFDEVDFNKVILDCGPAPLQVVIESCNQYISEKAFLYGLAN